MTTIQHTKSTVGGFGAVVVGEAELAVRFEVTLRGVVSESSVERFEDIYLAMGYLAHQAATADLNQFGQANPVNTIIVDINRLQEAPGPIAQALKQLAPEAKLLLVAESSKEALAKQAVAEGFDQYFLGPPTVSQLAIATGVGRTEHEPGQPDQESQSSATATETPIAQSHQPLGDIDLVENILTGRKGLAQLAVQLISQQSGLTDLGFVQSGQQVPSGHVAVEVKMAGQMHGFLHAPSPATDLQLTPWAAWLGRWLALDGRVAELQHMAMHDELTGAYNRRYFYRFLRKILDRAGDERFHVTVLVFDIDDFKIYNDRYGHSAGDEILCEATRLMKSLVRDHDVVARIGGDEFAVIFWEAGGPRGPGSEHPQTVHKLTERFQKAICAKRFPKLANEAPGTLTVSAGLAGFPWDGRTSEELVELADQMALQSKRNGKNAITLGPGVFKQVNGH